MAEENNKDTGKEKLSNEGKNINNNESITKQDSENKVTVMSTALYPFLYRMYGYDGDKSNIRVKRLSDDITIPAAKDENTPASIDILKSDFEALSSPDDISKAKILTKKQKKYQDKIRSKQADLDKRIAEIMDLREREEFLKEHSLTATDIYLIRNDVPFVTE